MQKVCVLDVEPQVPEGCTWVDGEGTSARCALDVLTLTQTCQDLRQSLKVRESGNEVNKGSGPYGKEINEKIVCR